MTIAPSSGAPGRAAPANTLAGVDAANASKHIDAMKKLSRKLLQQSQGIGAGAAVLQAIQAVWAMVMAILRKIARMFSPAPKNSEGSRLADDIAPAHPTAPTQAMAAVDNAAVPTHSMASDKIDEQAHVAQDLVEQIVKSAPPSALNQALDFAGIDTAARAMLQWVDNIEDFSSIQGPEQVLAAALQKGLGALQAMESKTLLAQSVRSELAAKLSANMQPPMLVEDLVCMYKASLAKGLVPQADIANATSLVQADDALGALVGHRNVIRQTLTVAAASAKNAGVDLHRQSALLTKVIGNDWPLGIDAACEEIKRSAQEVFTDLMGKMAAPKAPKVGFPEASAANSGFTSDNPATAPASGARRSLSDRLRVAQQASIEQNSLPLPSFDEPDEQQDMHPKS